MRQANATRPRLQAVNKVKAIRRIQAGGIACVTMSPGQWDQTLAAAYRAGWLPLDIGDDGRLVAAYRQPIVDGGQG